MKFTYVTTCKGRLAHLSQTLPAAVAQEDADWVVVDYGCPDGAGNWVLEHFPQVKVVRVTDDAGFNAARARNLGAAAAQSEWLAFVDADVQLAPDFFRRVSPGLAHGHFYLPDSGDPNTWGSCLVERSAFLAAGGYDEAIEGWGGEDNDLYAALALQGVRRGFYPGGFVTPIRHSDEERTRFHRIKGVDRTTRLHFVYRALKFDVMRAVARALGLEERRRLRQVAVQMVEAAAAGAAVPVRVDLPEREIKTRPALPEGRGPRLRCSLVYEIAGYGEEVDVAPGDDPGRDTSPTRADP